MALTRPTFDNINSNVSARFNDPVVVLNAANTSPSNQDIGFIFNRGSSGNVAVSWNETNDEFVLCYTTSSGQVDGNIADTGDANVSVGNIRATGYFYANGVAFAGGGGGVPGGSPTQIQYNNNGLFSGASGLTTDGNSITVNNSVTYGAGLVQSISSIVTDIGTTPKALDSFSASAYRSSKYVISVTDAVNSEYQTNDVVLVHNGTTVSVSSYGLVYSGESPRMTFSANISGGILTLWGTGASSNCTAKISKTMIPV